MKIHIKQIPEEGLRIEGEIPAEKLDLPSEGMRALGPLGCALDVGLSGGGLFATGSVWIPMEFECVSCLEPFRRTIRVDDLALQVPLTGPETVDLTPLLREDIFLALPAHPRCDWDGTNTCRGAGFGATSEPRGTPSKAAWEALDHLNLKPKPKE